MRVKVGQVNKARGTNIRLFDAVIIFIIIIAIIAAGRIKACYPSFLYVVISMHVMQRSSIQKAHAVRLSLHRNGEGKKRAI